MTTVKESIKMLTDFLPQDEDIIISWWGKDLFESAYEKFIKPEVWEKVVSEFDDVTEYYQALIYDKIVEMINENKGWIENE